MDDKEELLYINGLDATTGRPLIDPIPCNELAKRIASTLDSGELKRESKALVKGPFAPYTTLEDPLQARWGLLVHADEVEVMKCHLEGLIKYRDGRILRYQGESASEWVEINKAVDVNPNRFPYYVLIAGSPTKVPYELQIELNMYQAVGRIYFDNPDDYSCYAENVVKHEKGQTTKPGKRVVFFAPRHMGDEATIASSVGLVGRLLKELPEDLPRDLIIKDLTGKDATKDNLMSTLAPKEHGQTPAILFSASHGAGIPADNPDQSTLQGSILCQDFEEPLTRQHQEGAISGLDVTEGFQLPGGILFLFACYGAGTRARNEFSRYVAKAEDRQALETYHGKEDFVAYLPQALLADSEGGALAVVGHLDPTWTTSFTSSVGGERRIDSFGWALANLLRGKPVGWAMKSFNNRHRFYSELLLKLIQGKIDEPVTCSSYWICRNDIKNYVTTGDPAVRLRYG
jgi:hypothetical protein